MGVTWESVGVRWMWMQRDESGVKGCGSDGMWE